MRVLTVNAGSTSLKLVEVVAGEAVQRFADLDDALRGDRPDVVAHRVVHGGDRTDPVIVDDAVVAGLDDLTALAPLHQPPALKALRRCREHWPELPHVACFDTAFHATIPEAARTYALPRRWRSTVRAYGFHGLSHEWSVRAAARRAPGARRVVVAHLGGGQSLCAALDGRSVSTTMGFTPLDGLVMATRSGAVDPGAVLWLQERSGEDVAVVLGEESGLLGLCGTADMSEVVRRSAAGDAEAAFAFDVWRHRFLTQLGGCVAALGGLDALVFTGGVGEHVPEARATVAAGLGWLGVAVDEHRNAGEGGDREITAPGATVRTFVVTAREDLLLAAGAEASL